MKNTKADPIRWADMILREGIAAVRDIADTEMPTEHFASRDVNAVSYIGNLVSLEIRRRILLQILERDDVGWNLHRAAETIGASSAGTVLRLIKDTGLFGRYSEARRIGGGKPGQPPRALK